VGRVGQPLRDQLATLWPGARKVFCSVDSQIALAFLKRYPTPLDARRLGEQRLDAFLKRHSYPGRKPARDLLQRLRNGAEGRAANLRCKLAARSCWRRVRARADRRADQRADDRDPARARSAPDGQTFRSLFIAPDSSLCAATMIAEIGDCRERSPS
jgi:hypothetical protein